MHLFFAQITSPVEQHVSLFRLVQGGGWLMVILFVLSVVAVGVFGERWFFYKRCRMNVNEFLAVNGRSLPHAF